MSELAVLNDTQGVSVFNNMDSFKEAQRMIVPLMESTMVPDAYKGSAANCMVAMEMAHRIGKSVLEVMQNMQIVKGNAGWKSEYTIMCINRSNIFREPLEFVFAEDRKSCYAIATRHNGKEVRGTPVSMEMARAEGWLEKNGSKWKTMPEQMLMYRAATFFCRVFSPEVLAGVQTADEIIDIGYTEVRPSGSIAKFNETVSDPAEATDFEEVGENNEAAEIEVVGAEVVNETPATNEAEALPEDDDF